MEAPEKIYIHPDIGGREFLRPWLPRAANNESVEYVRKDAFIENTVNWLINNTNITPTGIKNYRKAMKGK